MKVDPYMMSMPEYEMRVKEVRKRKDVSEALIGFGLILISFWAIIIFLGGFTVCLVWGALILGVPLLIGGAALAASLRGEERALEQWKAWELRTQAKMREAGEHDFE